MLFPGAPAGLAAQKRAANGSAASEKRISELMMVKSSEHVALQVLGKKLQFKVL
jgi:hypothetical protein